MPELNFQPFPELRTERLVLRQLTAADAPDLFAIRSDERVNQYLDRPPAASLDDVLAFIEKINEGIARNESIYWVAALENKLVGTICLWQFSENPFRAEVGFELHPNFQGRGLMGEALRAVLDFGFQQLGLERIEGYTHIRNTASIKLMERFSFERREVLEVEDMVVYAVERGAKT